MQFILTDYIAQALAHAAYDKMEDSTFAGRIPSCPGVVSFGTTLTECEEKLRSVLEEWVVTGLKFNQTLPVINEIDLNRVAMDEQVATM